MQTWLKPQENELLESMLTAAWEQALSETIANRTTFAQWLPAVSPELHWDWPYIRYVREHLDRMTAGEIRKLMIFMPPQHGKTTLATIHYPVYRLERDPSLRIIIAAYNQTLAEKFSRKARRLASYRISISQERSSVADWETPQGGGVRAVGIGGGITGMGGDLIVIEDPIKSREEAESQAYRDRAWDWYTNDLYTRQSPHCSFIFPTTRWHKDDPAGRILASDDGPAWTVISLPAEAEPGDPLGRAIGDPLCPERFDTVALADFRRTLGRDYHALYQQQPRAREGGMFKEIWLPLVDAVPARAARVRWWDKGATEGGGDPTAGVLVAYAGGIAYIEDVIRGQWAAGERDATIRRTAEKDKETYGPVIYWGEQEPGASGKDAAAAFVKLLAGYPVYTEPTTGSKKTACDPLASQAEAGNVRIKRAPWASAFISEACDFPSGTHDDQIESAARAFNKLARHPEPASATNTEARQVHAPKPRSSWQRQ